jgi:hypothetical protein
LKTQFDFVQAKSIFRFPIAEHFRAHWLVAQKQA